MFDRLTNMLLKKRKKVKEDSFVTAIEFNEHKNLGILVAGQPQILDSASLDLKFKYSVEDSNKVGIITGIRFVDQDVLVTSGADGYIRTYDIRHENPVMTLASTIRPEANEELKPLICCDVSIDGHMVAAGSEAVKDDAFILFWDIRNTKQLVGGYWESHSKDVTQVKFHPKKRGLLATGGVDGLVNAFDLAAGLEDDALQYTLNIGCAVNHLAWLPQSVQNIDCLGIATTESEFQLWKEGEAEPITRLAKDHLRADHMEVTVDHIIAINEYKSRGIFLTSSNHGSVDIWTVFGAHVAYLGHARDKVSSGHKDLVKSAALSAEEKGCTIWTSGDDGFVCQWRSDVNFEKQETRNDRKSEMSIKERTKAQRHVPY